MRPAAMIGKAHGKIAKLKRSLCVGSAKRIYLDEPPHLEAHFFALDVVVFNRPKSKPILTEGYPMHIGFYMTCFCMGSWEPAMALWGRVAL